MRGGSHARVASRRSARPLTWSSSSTCWKGARPRQQRAQWRLTLPRPLYRRRRRRPRPRRHRRAAKCDPIPGSGFRPHRCSRHRLTSSAGLCRLPRHRSTPVQGFIIMTCRGKVLQLVRITKFSVTFFYINIAKAFSDIYLSVRTQKSCRKMSFGRFVPRLIDWAFNWSIDWLIDWIFAYFAEETTVPDSKAPPAPLPGPRSRENSRRFSCRHRSHRTLIWLIWTLLRTIKPENMAIFRMLTSWIPSPNLNMKTPVRQHI